MYIKLYFSFKIYINRQTEDLENKLIRVHNFTYINVRITQADSDKQSQCNQKKKKR